jgi:1-acyl-sn-glycerol-3-phosphate acyltransferase
MNTIKGLTAILFMTLNTAAVWSVLWFWVIQRIWTSGEKLVDLKERMDKIIWWWTGGNRWLLKRLDLIEPDIDWKHIDDVSLDKWYLVISNHQSWTDIILLQSYLYGKIPPLKFFTKQQLIWVPGIGLAMYVLGFPYVKRVSKAQIKANPNLRNADRDNIAEACKGFKNHPTSILNFLEGTRRTSAKQLNQSSDYKNLLRPKIGGIEYVIKDMGDNLHKLIDVTIVYPDGTPTFWQFVKGECRSVKFVVSHHEIPKEVLVDNDIERRSSLSGWIKTIWMQKDQQISEMTQTTNVP